MSVTLSDETVEALRAALNPNGTGTVNLIPDAENWTVYEPDGSVRTRSEVVEKTATANASGTVLTFADTTGVEVGMGLWNREAPICVPGGATVTAVTSTTVTISATLRSPGVTSGDLIRFVSNPDFFSDAVAHAAANGYALKATGQAAHDDTVGSTLLLVTDAPVTIPASIFSHIDLTGVQVELVGSDGLIFDSAEYMTFKGPSVIAYHGDGAAVKFDASNQTPVDHLVGFSGNIWEFGVITVQGGVTGALNIHVTDCVFSENRIIAKEFFGGRRALEGGGYSDTLIQVDGTPAYNRWEINHLHAYTGKAIKENGGHDNTWTVGKIAPRHADGIGFETYADRGTWETAVTNDEMTGSYSRPFISHGDENRFAVNHVGASSGVLDNGADNAVMANGGMSFGYVAMGSQPATAGALRLSNGQAIVARDSSNTFNMELLKLDSSDVPAFGINRVLATNAANFSPDYWLQFHDAAGNNAYLPVKGSAW